jgi:hypothetical protein
MSFRKLTLAIAMQSTIESNSGWSQCGDGDTMGRPCLDVALGRLL